MGRCGAPTDQTEERDGTGQPEDKTGVSPIINGGRLGHRGVTIHDSEILSELATASDKLFEFL